MIQDYIWLNGVQLPIKGAVAWRRVTPFPNQIMMGAPSENDYTPTSKQRWGTLKGGMGKDKWSAQDNDRAAEASVDTSQEVTTLPSLVTTIEKSDGTGFGTIPVKIIKFKDQIWAIGHNQISYWDGTEWQSTKTDLSNPTDAILFYGVS